MTHPYKLVDLWCIFLFEILHALYLLISLGLPYTTLTMHRFSEYNLMEIFWDIGLLISF
jgi:hypothetical protein